MTPNRKYFGYFVVLAVLLVLLGTLGAFIVRGAGHPGRSDPYHFPVLRLSKGTVVETRDGHYLAEKDEMWFSEQQFRALQKEKEYLAGELQRQQRMRR